EADRATIKRAISDEITACEEAPAAPGPSAPAATADDLPLEELINRVLFDLTRQFQVPIAAAYVQLADHRRFAAYGSVVEPLQTLEWSKVFELLPHAAGGDEALVVPEVENHPLFGA